MLAEHAQFVCENALKLNDAARNLVRVWLVAMATGDVIRFVDYFPRSLLLLQRPVPVCATPGSARLLLR
jgi:hypothetical protein